MQNISFCSVQKLQRKQPEFNKCDFKCKFMREETCWMTSSWAVNLLNRRQMPWGFRMALHLCALLTTRFNYCAVLCEAISFNLQRVAIMKDTTIASYGNSTLVAFPHRMISTSLQSSAWSTANIQNLSSCWVHWLSDKRGATSPMCYLHWNVDKLVDNQHK